MENTETTHLYRLRHSLAHVLAQAVLQVRPHSQLAFGPPVDNGCYYDFLFDTPLTPDDFQDIEKRMRRIINDRQEFKESSRTVQQAVEHLAAHKQEFKVEYCKELGERGETTIGFYQNGPFEDMCAGPHLEHTGQIPPDCFKVDSLAGAYWRGSEKNPQLTRIYVLAFENKKSLDEYLVNRKLAQERDHRKLGKELELFLISDMVGPGLPLWTPNGTVIKEELEKLAKEEEQRCGYVRVSTPHIAKESLYQLSGHLPYYADSMFPPMNVEGESNYYLKAMNCPHHHMIYSHRPRSYRELPLKMAEFGTVYRYEPSGTLSGLLRVRSICQNDAHIYCTLDQLKSQIKETAELTLSYFNRFRFQGISVRFSTHDPANKDKFLDQPELWSFSEKVVQEVIDENGITVVPGFGEAAFYGPKLDFQARTLLGREESIATTQLDFGQPLRFDLKYTGEDGKEHRPYVIHRAPLGSHERFMAFLIEHLGGAFPTWLAPIQVMLIPVSAHFDSYVSELESALRNNLIRVESDRSDNSFNKKIREAVTRKIPNMVIIGGKEVENNQITLRRYCTKEQITMDRGEFIERCNKLNAGRIMDNFADVII
jgi:threonyl-tRNA synthetase